MGNCMPDPKLNDPHAGPSESSWPWATAWMVTVVACLGAGFFALKTCSKIPGETAVATSNAVTNVVRALADVASAFTRQTITTTFSSYATSLHPSQFLQFATLKQTEAFTQSNQTVTGFGYIPLPEIIVEARAPVEFTYYLDLDAEWKFELIDDVVVVRAPRIRFNKPAIDAAEITYEVRKGSLLRNHEQALEELKKSLTSLAHLRARENIALVRDTGRRQVVEFVEKWLAHTFSDGENYAVKVYFEGEAPELNARIVELQQSE